MIVILLFAIAVSLLSMAGLLPIALACVGVVIALFVLKFIREIAEVFYEVLGVIASDVWTWAKTRTWKTLFTNVIP